MNSLAQPGATIGVLVLAMTAVAGIETIIPLRLPFRAESGPASGVEGPHPPRRLAILKQGRPPWP